MWSLKAEGDFQFGNKTTPLLGKRFAGGFFGTLRLENLWSLAASREGQHLEVNYELATRLRHSPRSLTF
jgi:hypothetical protein